TPALLLAQTAAEPHALVDRAHGLDAHRLHRHPHGCRSGECAAARARPGVALGLDRTAGGTGNGNLDVDPVLSEEVRQSYVGGAAGEPGQRVSASAGGGASSSLAQVVGASSNGPPPAASERNHGHP